MECGYVVVWSKAREIGGMDGNLFGMKLAVDGPEEYNGLFDSNER